MANIVPKLNLNKTPNLVENNSFVFAKNIRLDVDGTIHRDYGISKIGRTNTFTIFDRIVKDIEEAIDLDTTNTLPEIYTITKKVISNHNYNRKVVGVISNNNECYLFIHLNKKDTPIFKVNKLGSLGTSFKYKDKGKYSKDNYSWIIKYKETTNKFSPCNCNWTYNGGEICGVVVNNLRNETILVIAESNTESLVPLKCINITTSDYTDDESIYTQAPNIPITNLNYDTDFNFTIPNGVYQFYVRYRIKENFYTNWFPASSEIYANNTNIEGTSYGLVKYCNIHTDSDYSFKLKTEHLIQENIKNYIDFQVGFILSHDDSIVARAWKHFSFKDAFIYFDYNAKDAEEVEVIDMLQSTYSIHNVGNLAEFKNKIYISNYTETDINNKSLQEFANKIEIRIDDINPNQTYAGCDIVYEDINQENSLIKGLRVHGEDKLFSDIIGNNSILEEFINEQWYYGKNIDPTTKSDYTLITSFSTIIYSGEFPDNPTSGMSYSNYGLFVNVDTVEGYNTINKCVDIYCEENGYDYYDERLEFTPNAEWFSIKHGDTFLVKDKEIKTESIDSVINDEAAEEIINEILKNKFYLTKLAEIVDENKNDRSRLTIILYRDVSINTNGTITHDKYRQELEFYINADEKEFGVRSSDISQRTTLIPYQKYKFYVHYITEKGEVTNGYYCGGENAGIITAPYSAKANKVIYPVFSNIQRPTGYVACFFSIIKVSNIVSTITDLGKNYNITRENNIVGTCFDFMTFCVPTTKSIVIRQDKAENRNAKYYRSSNNSKYEYFGDRGVLEFNIEENTDDINKFIVHNYNQISDTSNDNNDPNDKLAYAIFLYNSSDNDEFIELVKCTPYIKLDKNPVIYRIYRDMNLLGYICDIYLLDYNRTSKYYNDGSSVFKTYRNPGDKQIKLTELKIHNMSSGDEDSYGAMTLLSNTELTYSYAVRHIYSNYNLNCVTLTEDIIQSNKTGYYGADEASSQRTSVLIRLIKSLTMSEMYTLPSMYKSYTRKLYYPYNTTTITKFDNTIRSSEYNGDEEYFNVFKFHPNDYYNTPVSKGIITNLVSVGDIILVHTTDSMFKFSGSNTIQSSNGEIQPTENQPFDTGISEIFGSDFGFAGLKNKHNSIVCELGYIFYDFDSRIIYMYSGQGQIVKLSDSIEKLFRHRNIKEINFANDYYNNRIFISILFEENNVIYPVTLSFSILQDVKSFVSLHDFYFTKAFNTKTKCYFYNRADTDILTIDKTKQCDYTNLTFTDKIYPTSKTDNTFDSIIDVIVNDSYENIKSLDAINWYSNNIDSEYTDIDNDNLVTLKMSEDINADYPCKAMWIYSDTCMSPIIDFSDIANNYSITSENSYKYPRYNQGFWTFSYFRNIQHSNNNITTYVGDENSLIEGKYFVIRFYFNKPFKLETLSLNYKIK